MKKGFLLIISFLVISCNCQAKEQISGSLTTFVYGATEVPKKGCLYEYNPSWFPLRVIQAVNGGILVSGDYRYGTPFGMKNIYIQTSKPFVSDQWLTDTEVVKYVGIYEYTTVLGAKQRVWKFYRYGKNEIAQKVDTSYFKKTVNYGPNSKQNSKENPLKFSKNTPPEEMLVKIEKEINEGKMGNCTSFFDLLSEDLTSWKNGHGSLIGDIYEQTKHYYNDSDKKSLINRKYLDMSKESMKFIERGELACGKGKILIDPQDKPLLDNNVYLLILMLNKALDYCDT